MNREKQASATTSQLHACERKKRKFTKDNINIQLQQI